MPPNSSQNLPPPAAEAGTLFSMAFRVKDLLRRWNTTDRSRIRAAISTAMSGTSRTIVFVGNNTYRSYWVPEEVEMTLEARKPVYAIRLSGRTGQRPAF